MFVVDSLQCGGVAEYSVIQDAICEWLGNESTHDSSMYKRYMPFFIALSTQQKNSFDCGVHALMNVILFVKSYKGACTDISDFSEHDEDGVFCQYTEQDIASLRGGLQKLLQVFQVRTRLTFEPSDVSESRSGQPYESKVGVSIETTLGHEGHDPDTSSISSNGSSTGVEDIELTPFPYRHACSHKWFPDVTRGVTVLIDGKTHIVCSREDARLMRNHDLYLSNCGFLRDNHKPDLLVGRDYSPVSSNDFPLRLHNKPPWEGGMRSECRMTACLMLGVQCHRHYGPICQGDTTCGRKSHETCGEHYSDGYVNVFVNGKDVVNLQRKVALVGVYVCRIDGSLGCKLGWVKVFPSQILGEFIFFWNCVSDPI